MKCSFFAVVVLFIATVALAQERDEPVDPDFEIAVDEETLLGNVSPSSAPSESATDSGFVVEATQSLVALDRTLSLGDELSDSDIEEDEAEANGSEIAEDALDDLEVADDNGVGVLSFNMITVLSASLMTGMATFFVL